MSMCSPQPNCPVCNHYTFIYNRPIFCPDCSTYSTYKAIDESFKSLDEAFKLPPPKKTSVRPLAKRQKKMSDSDKTLLKSWSNMQ